MASTNSAKCLIINVEEVSPNFFSKMSANLNELIHCHSPAKKSKTPFFRGNNKLISLDLLTF